ncbi:conjugal transfer protein [Streptomyces sp. NPDC004286]|uniref:conjugal transfer protein n=1 Tax=Streptomyces sp. NPDC004286 TaxID=3364696 RepID=UPI0036B18367
MSPRKKELDSGAAAPLATRTHLDEMRRRVRLSRAAVWALIAAGPVALCVAAASTPTSSVQEATTDKPAAVRAPAGGADPSGYAQVFLSAWLRSSADEATTAQARLAQSMAPDVELPAAGGKQVPAFVTAVRSAQRGGGAWAVTVAAQYGDGSVRYYEVPGVSNRSGSSFTVTRAPGVVAGPEPAAVPKSSYGVTVPDGDLVSTAGEFLAAYLTGAGEVDRYLAPAVTLAPVSPSPFTSVAVEQVSAVEDVAAAEKVPADGTTVRVLVSLEARGDGGLWPLGYELTLMSRSGRWEVAGLGSAVGRSGGVR